MIDLLVQEGIGLLIIGKNPLWRKHVSVADGMGAGIMPAGSGSSMLA
jgi:hypothetical protein